MSRLNQVLIARIKSYGWNAFGVGAVAFLGWAANNVGLLELPTIHVTSVAVDLNFWLTIVLGHLVTEATKYFNVNRAWVNDQP